MANIAQQLLKLTNALFPTGRAFRNPLNGILDRVYRGLNDSELRAYNHALDVLDSILPDNDDFTAQDAADWERRLGIASSVTTSLQDRKDAIARKYRHPGNIPSRQSISYIEGQLQAAGFNVFCFENTAGDPPNTYINTINFTHGSESAFHGSGLTSGGGLSTFLVVNSIDPEVDASFNLGTDFTKFFWIGGTPIGTSVNVPLAREAEFRQLILNLKPTHLAAALIVNFT